MSHRFYKSDACPGMIPNCNMGETYTNAFYPCTTSSQLDRSHDCVVGRVVDRVSRLLDGQQVDQGHESAINVGATYYSECLRKEGIDWAGTLDIIRRDANELLDGVPGAPSAVQRVVDSIKQIPIRTAISAKCAASIQNELDALDDVVSAHAIKKCALCDGEGVNASTCPRNPNARNTKPRKHNA